MHQHFADWYREASIDASGERLDLRWQGVESATQEDLTSEHIADLFSWAYSVDPDPGSPGWIRPHFQNNDSAFPMRGNDQEMAVLAASVLINELELESALPLVALGAVNAAFVLGDSVVPDLTGSAAVWVSAQAEARRRIPALPKRVRLDDWSKAKSQIDSLDQLPEPTQSVQHAKHLKRILAAASSTFETMRTAHNALAAYCRAVGEARGEEVDLYWWALRHRSGPSESEGTVDEGFRLAQELTVLTAFDVEHPSAGPLLRHALTDPDETVSFKDVAATASKPLAQSGPPFQLAPLLHLLRGHGPPQTLERRTKEAESNALSAADLCLAFHRELLAECQWKT